MELSREAAFAPAFEIAPMLVADLGAVLAIESLIHAFPWNERHFNDALSAGYSAFIARQGGEVVGYAVLMLALDEAHLLNLGVAKHRQRQGLGARLLRYVMQQAIRLGGSKIFLEVRPSNATALRLYRHLGFISVGRRKEYYPAENGREDAIVMARSLDDDSVCSPKQ